MSKLNLLWIILFVGLMIMLPALLGLSFSPFASVSQAEGTTLPLGQPPCQLTPETDCEFDRESRPNTIQTYPIAGEQGVPRHAWISVTFPDKMDQSTLTADTFLVSTDGVLIDGEVIYIPSHRIAVFQPKEALATDTTYQARLTTAVKNQQGAALAAEIVWEFTTESLLPQPSFSLTEAPSASSMNIYFGDLHAHSGYSGGQGTPNEAFTSARANGLNFFALTEHAFLMTEPEWQDVRTQAISSTVDGVFVGLSGFEFHHPAGHINVFATDTYVQYTNPNYDDLFEFYAWLISQPSALGQFNHPHPNFNFYNFAYDPIVDHKIRLQELISAEQFFLGANQGWHTGVLLNSDTHIKDWGCCRRMGLLASALTPAAILDGMRASRTFYVPPNDFNFALIMQANGQWMGSAVEETSTLNVTVQAHNPDPTGSWLYLNLYDNGSLVASTVLPETSAITTWTPTVPATVGHYYYAEAYRAGWWVPAYSSPVWVERRPLAEAGPDFLAPAGGAITLNGGASTDGDGDALAYVWSQESGSAVAWGQTNEFQATTTLTAPITSETLTFRLTVTDSGGLSDSDTTMVTVTDQPILSISKSGPVSVETGSPITYTLTLSNVGIMTATDVTVTDTLPVGANYVSGGTLIAGQVVSWTVPSLSRNGGSVQVSFVVTTAGTIVNNKYGAACATCIPAMGTVSIYTNLGDIYLPIIQKSP